MKVYEPRRGDEFRKLQTSCRPDKVPRWHQAAQRGQTYHFSKSEVITTVAVAELGTVSASGALTG